MPSKLTWDNVGEKLYETGTDRGVIYPYDTAKKEYGTGIAWSGLTGVTESPSGAEQTALYADNIKYITLISAEDFGGSIKCYMYPDAFKPCIGEKTVAEGVTIGQQNRSTFGFSYRTLIGNDTEGTTHGYKIHLVYGCTASVSDKDNTTVNDSPSANEMSFDFTSTPVNVNLEGCKPTAHVVIDSTGLTTAKLKAVEDLIYGSSSADAKLPTPDEIVTAINAVNE